MQTPKFIFRQYDIRGIVDHELTTPFAEALGRAIGTLAWHKLGRQPVLAVGRDNRPSGAALAGALRTGIVATGAIAVDIGMVPTPALYFAAAAPGIDGGVQVTGSHNPPEFNGFKTTIAGEAVHGEEILDLRQTITLETWRTGAGQERTDGGVLGRYVEAILARHRLSRPVKVVVDAGNGVGALIAVELLEALGCDVTPLFCESDGTFPNHHPDPTVEENLIDLQAAVRRTGAELGIAFDGDADRIGAVDENGRILWGDQLLILFGRDAVRRFGPGVPVIFDVKCSELLPQALLRAGARPEMWKTGHSLIKARMKELKSPLAGEMSGHIFFGGDWFGFDDAPFAAARLLEIVAAGTTHGIAPLLADLPSTFTTPEIRVECDEETKFAIVERAAAHFAAKYPIVTIDGVRMTFPKGWGLIRASNTQAILVLRFEATDAASRDAYRAEVTDWLGTQGVRT